MYSLKRMWLKFRSHIGMYIFMWLQFAVIIYIVSTEVNILNDQYYETHFVDEYDDNMYMYSNSVQRIMENIDYSKETQIMTQVYEFINYINTLDGVRGVGYDCVLSDYNRYNGNGDERLVYLNEVMASVSYNNIEGEWFLEEDNSHDYINVVVGSELGKLYGVGEKFVVENEETDVSYECRVIGVIQEGTGIIALNTGGSDKSLPQNNLGEWCIYTADERVLENVDIENYGYPAISLLLLLEDEYDEEELSKYGSLYALKYMENCSKDYFSYVFNYVFAEYGVLIYVILFGTFAAIYLTTSKGMYTIGVYSLLGMTKSRIVVENLIVHLLTYVSAVVVAYFAYNNSADAIEMWGEKPWNSWHNIFVITLGCITSLITVVTSICMIQKKPKEIMAMAKSIEG